MLTSLPTWTDLPLRCRCTVNGLALPEMAAVNISLRTRAAAQPRAAPAAWAASIRGLGPQT
ncbi:hypothetical protein ASF43_18625 [Pseudorhodoferax sp. Leaf267]|nr:hypothetical protein ASF43_18625 [Pseudorhodoferax sp. Leaf267]